MGKKQPILYEIRDGEEYKRCTKCFVFQPKGLSHFSAHQSCKDGLNSQCRVCHKAYNKTPDQLKKASANAKKRRREKKAEDPNFFKSEKIRITYKLKREVYENMFEEQGFKCMICQEASIKPYTKHSHVDHCHKTGKVRGILCKDCNLGLGRFKDSVESLERAIDYLRRPAC